MPMWSLTFERVEELKRLVKDKEEELLRLKKTTVQEMWVEDLDKFEEVLDDIEEQEENEIRQQMGLKSTGGKTVTKVVKKTKKQTKMYSDSEDFMDQESEFDSEEDYGKKKKKGSKKGSKGSQNDANKLDNMKVSLSQETGISSRIGRRDFAPKPSQNSQLTPKNS